MPKTINYTAKGIKGLVSAATFVLTFIYTFKWSNQLIHWIASGFQSHDGQLACVIILWVVCFSVVLGIAIGLASLLSALIAMLLGVHKS